MDLRTDAKMTFLGGRLQPSLFILSIIFLHSMEPASSLPCLQQPTTCTLHKQGESNFQLSITSLKSTLILFP